MLQLSLLLPAMPPVPVRPALLGSGATSSFALALNALVLPQASLAAPDVAVPAREGEDQPLLPGRQKSAESGKDLPELMEDAAAGEEEDAPKDGADIAFAWFAVVPATALPPAAPSMTLAAPSVPGTATKLDSDAPGAEIRLLPELASAAPPQNDKGVETLAPAEPSVSPAVATVAAEPDAGTPPMRLTKPLEQTEPLPVTAGAAPERAAFKAPMLASPIREAADEPTPSAVAVAVARPAAPIAPGEPGIRFTEALDRLPETGVRPAQEPLAQRPVLAPRQTPDRQRVVLPALAPVVAAPLMNRLTPSVTPLVLASASTAPVAPRRAAQAGPMAAGAQISVVDAPQPHPVSAAADIQQGAVDTRRQEWVGKMVEHIEALRDAAPVRETRLSLAPEALGKVEISIRHEGDRVHVHFATETPAARQLIADAQPRLGELAEARGLKLGQTSFESGTAGQGANRDSRDHPASQPSLRPRPAKPDSTVGAADDDRIA